MATLQMLFALNRPSFQCRFLVKNLPSNTSLGNNRKVPYFALPRRECGCWNTDRLTLRSV